MSRSKRSRKVKGNKITKYKKLKVKTTTKVTKKIKNKAKKTKIAKIISDYKKNQRYFKESESRYRTLVETSPDAIILTDLDGVIIICNQQAALLYGCVNINELLERSIFKFIADEDKQRAYENMGTVLKEGAIKNVEYTLLRKSGARYPAELSTAVVSDPKNKPKAFIYIIRDITERKVMEREREKLQQKLIHSEKMLAVGRLAGDVVNEFNNPLAIILGFAQSLIKQVTSNKMMLNHVVSIEREAQRCKNLVQDLLSLSELSDVERKNSNIEAIIEDALVVLDARLKDKHITMVRKLKEKLPKVYANPMQLRQVIVNLCNNAIDSSRDNSEITIQVESVNKDNKNFVEIQVQDKGSGISKDIKHKIFEPFFTTKSAEKKSGLGLSLVYEIVQRHLGKIDVISEEGKGTSVKVIIPVDEKSIQEIKLRKKVLVVDDQPEMLRLIEVALVDLNVDMIFAKDGFEAGKLSSEQKPDLVILDIYLPGINGFKTCEKIRSDEKLKFTKILAISGINIEETREKIIKAGADDFISKPFDLDFLREKVSRILNI